MHRNARHACNGEVRAAPAATWHTSSAAPDKLRRKPSARLRRDRSTWRPHAARTGLRADTSAVRHGGTVAPPGGALPDQHISAGSDVAARSFHPGDRRAVAPATPARPRGAMHVMTVNRPT
ncbi:hypothetical protein [Xanthomonas indica]|uniref:Uncharacterized protein n=1 Tax=Xanthomonas indica TaxID=2912242 RepID=A0AAU8I766_9XANT|nr:hypothetical protein [Xanthomonas indica]MCI2260513.1 hypothetical protein [Xanthomonas indica]